MVGNLSVEQEVIYWLKIIEDISTILTLSEPELFLAYKKYWKKKDD